MRVDATRNRRRILAAARELVARDGTEASMDAIAAEAGVAVGTLYRHFPTKTHLVEAVVDDRIDTIADLAEAAAERGAQLGNAGAELTGLFRQLAEQHAENKALKSAAAALGGTGHITEDVDSPARRAEAALTRVVDQARTADAVRPDLTLTDLMMLLAGVPVDEQQRSRYLEIVLTGLTLGASGSDH